MMKTFRTPLFAAALLTGVTTVGLAPVFAQTAAAPANSAAAEHPAEHPAEHTMRGMLPGQLVDGRIAFLKTELKITPGQEAQWQEVAAAMRQNAEALDQAITGARGHQGGMNAVERIEIRGQFAKVQADNDARLLVAFKPLYASLSPEQQQVANALMTMEHDGHHGWHRHA
jgi:periplasmic protein CpxP/Spy